jgi:hypothetical protein
VHLRALLFYAAPLNDARKTISGNCFGVFISLKFIGNPRAARLLRCCGEVDAARSRI